jgi:hypothetical protein
MSTFLLREKVLRPEGAEYGVAIFRSAMKKNMFFFCIFLNNFVFLHHETKLQSTLFKSVKSHLKIK